MSIASPSGHAAVIQSVLRLRSKNLGVPMDTWHKANTDRSSDCFCDFPLVHWTQPSLAAVLDTAHWRHIFRHDGEILTSEAYLISKLVLL